VRSDETFKFASPIARQQFITAVITHPMKYLMALLASIVSAWMFYFLVGAFFVQFGSLPVILVWIVNLVFYMFSLNAAHVISRMFSIMALETLVVPVAALLHFLASDRDFLLSFQKEGQSPTLIQYLINTGWDTEQLVLTSLGIILLFSVLAFFLTSERYAVK
jgi:hypothetical protein